MKLFRSTLSLVAALAAVTSPAAAQVATGSLSGVVTDANGAVVPAAKIVARHVATGVESRTNSSDAGLYVFATLPVGDYSVTVEKGGFRKVTQTGLEIRIASRQELDIRLEVGDVAQSVEVTAEAPLLETTSTQRGQQVSAKMMSNLPLFSGGIRNPQAFVTFMPGVNPGAETSISGSGGRAAEILIDGASLTIPESGGAVFNFPAAEMFGEFKLLNGTYDAEYGRFGGGVQIFVTKSGTNDLHGGGFLNLRRDIWNANSWANNSRGAARPKDRFNEQGGYVGGPVFLPKIYDGRNKTFFYFTYSKDKRPVAITGTPISTVPTALMRTGVFTELPASQIIYDPATTVGNTRQPFPNQTIPRNRFSQISSKLIDALPSPTRSALLSNYDFINTQIYDRYIWNLKFDHAFSANNRLAFLVTKENQNDNNVGAFAGPLGQSLQNFQKPDNWRWNHDYVFRPNFLMHTTVGYSRTRQSWSNPYQFGAASRFGFPGLTGNSDSMPRVQFTGADGYTNWGVQDGKVNNGLQNNITYQISQGFNWIRGKHEFKFGWDVRRLQTIADDAAGSNGLYIFARAQTALPTALATTGNAFASLLLGSPDSAQRVATPVLVANIRYGYHAGYFQDTWKVNNRLTLNLGMRYDLPIGWHEVNGDYSSVNLNKPNPAAGNRMGAYEFYGSGAGRTGEKRPYATDFTNFGPRAGFSYRVMDKTVLRGGFGIFYQTLGNGGCGCRIGFANPIQLNSDGVNGAIANWDGGIPAPAGFRPPPLLDPTIGNNNDVDVFSNNFGKAPRVYNWSFSIQHEVKRFVFDIAYSANRARGLNSTLDLNQLPTDRLALGSLLSRPISSPEVVAAGFTKPYASFPDNGSLAQALRPYPQFFGVLERNAGVGRTWYDSLQIKGERRFGDFQIYGSFVWSKSLALAHYRQIFSQSQVWPQDMYNVNDMKSYLPFDLPFVTNFMTTYDLPFGKGKKLFAGANGLVNGIIGNWTISAVGQYRSGALIQLTAPNTLNNGVIFSRLKKANVGSGPIQTGIDRTSLDPNDPSSRWFNPAAFSIPGQYELGNAALYYNDFRNPPVLYENFSVAKRLKFPVYGDRTVNLTYRADAFNMFNRTAFGGVNGTVGNAAFGRPTGPQVGARMITMGLRLEF